MGSSLSIYSIGERNCQILQYAVPLIACFGVAKFCCFEPSPAYEQVFSLLKRPTLLFSFNVFYEIVNIFIVMVYIYNSVKNIDLLC